MLKDILKTLKFGAKWDIYLTQVTPTCSMSGEVLGPWTTTTLEI